MIKGFTILEVLVSLTLCLTILGVVISNVDQSLKFTKRVINNQQVLESIFHTVDVIKNDLTKCGMRLQKIGQHFDLSNFEHTASSFKLTYGRTSDYLTSRTDAGENSIFIDNSRFFKPRKTVLIYNPEVSCYEYNEIKEINENNLILKENLLHSYPEKSTIVMLKIIEYKLYAQQNILKRKIDRGYFQPLIEYVSDFYITFFPESNSVLYKLEVNNKEQVRGYIFLNNMVHK